MDNKGLCGAILTDLSKDFNYDLLIEKFHTYCLQHDALKFLDSYLSKRWHRTKVNRFLVHGRNLGPLLFNLNLNDLLYLLLLLLLLLLILLLLLLLLLLSLLLLLVLYLMLTFPNFTSQLMSAIQ